MDMVPTTMANATIIPLQGQINSMNAQALEAQLLALVHGGARQIVLDCTGLEYLSSAGLRESHVHDVIITREAPNYRTDGL